LIAVTPQSIIRFPDPRLRQPCEVVSAFDEDLRAFAGDLLEVMRAAPGIGMTAAHVGILKRIVVIELTGHPVPRFYVNPVVVDASAETARHAEGSVSMPGIVEEIERPARVTVSFRGLDGSEGSEIAEGLLAVCLQHEIDQLDGIFFLQRLSRLKRDRAIKKWEKLRG